jgi:hypothetical protein
MEFASLSDFGSFFLNLGVTRAFFKPLSENDNSKNQIYLGGSFEVLQQLPFGKIKEFPDNKDPNYKAPINLWWINEGGNYSQAPNAQLILYTRYPEVRLSGFLMKCPTAPREYLQPILREERKNNNEKDGRVLLFGICPDGKVYTYLARGHSQLAKTILSSLYISRAGKAIFDFPLRGNICDDKAALLEKLHDVISTGWHESARLDASGNNQPYQARNGGGYTLEALFGIIPNGIAEPDYRGWELKSFSGKRITLMTPEPDQGFYHIYGSKEFTLKYGHASPGAVKYFTGTHKTGILNKTSNMTLVITGFDYRKETITDMSGGLFLLDNNNEPAAIWSFNRLITHWGRKHAKVCYVNCKPEEKLGRIGYMYYSPVYLGEGTNFSYFLKTLQSGLIVYDPATKVTKNNNGNLVVKSRSQFRINYDNLKYLYKNFYEQSV